VQVDPFGQTEKHLPVERGHGLDGKQADPARQTGARSGVPPQLRHEACLRMLGANFR